MTGIGGTNRLNFICHTYLVKNIYLVENIYYAYIND